MKNNKYPLTAAQKNIFDMQAFYSDSSISTLCGAIIFERRLDRELLVSALKKLVGRHEALRLRFCSEGGIIMQFACKDEGEIGFERFDSADRMHEYCHAQARRRFETNGEKMYRLTVFELPEQTGIMLCCSHLIADAWSYSILARDVYCIYEQLKNDVAIKDEIRSYTGSLEKYYKYMRSEKHDADADYWKNKYISGTGQTAVRACHNNAPGIFSKRYVTAMSSELFSQAKSFCRQNCISLAALFEGAVLLYLARINSAGKITIGVPVLGRTTAAEKKTAGMYITTLPLTIDVNGDETALSLCKKVFAAHREIYRRRRLPFAEIKAAAGVSGRLFDVLVSFQNSRTEVPAKTEWFSGGCSELPLSLHIDDRDSSQNCTLTLDYQTDIFPDSREIELLAGRIKNIVSQMIGGDVDVNRISLIPDTEYELLVNKFNATSAGYSKDSCVHRAFSETAAQYPDKTALIFHGRKFTYKQLDEMSDTFAAFLADKGIAAGDILPVIARRSPYVIIAMLAVLKVGAAYMPVSPDHPAERVRYMIESVGAKTVLTCGCGGEYENAIASDSFDYRQTTNFTPSECSPDYLCYVIFTSGSTGRPKAAAVTHRNVMNYCAKNKYNVCGRIIDKENSIVSVTDFVFDIFVTESILALLNGITVILTDDEQAVSQRLLSRLVRETGADILQTTPTKMRGFMLDKNDLGHLGAFSKIMLGGEELPPALVRELKQHTDAKIYNVYGPAETTVWSALTEADENDITIGRPIANTKIYILDKEHRLLPVGVVGEICISGDGVSRGYLTDKSLTADHFIPDPFGEGTMYRTGDLGLIRADGSIEFFSRSDSQIKLHGLRIEPGEIECAMCGFEGIGLAAVSCKNDRLIGFYTSDNVIDERRLRQYLHTKLPSYMVPNGFVRLEKMPMTQSGKLDRKALPNAAAAVSRQKYTVPANESERQLCAVMAEILKLQQVGVEDDFFELGGDSFAAMELAAAAEDKGLHFSVRSVYEQRTVRRLCSEAYKPQSLAVTEKHLKEKYRRYPQKRTVCDLMFFDTFVRLTKMLYRFDVIGLENLDPNEKYIICPNHVSDLDCMWVWAALSEKFHLCECCALIAEEHLDDPIKRFIFRVSGGIPIDRRGDFAPALNRAAAVLMKHCRLLLIHPEGTRTRSGKLGRLKAGAALISKKTGIKIVPVKLTGAGEIYPVSRRSPHLFDTKHLNRYSLSIVFGKPTEPAGKSAGEIMDEVERRLKQEGV